MSRRKPIAMKSIDSFFSAQPGKVVRVGGLPGVVCDECGQLFSTQGIKNHLRKCRATKKQRPSYGKVKCGEVFEKPVMFSKEESISVVADIEVETVMDLEKSKKKRSRDRQASFRCRRESE